MKGWRQSVAHAGMPRSMRLKSLALGRTPNDPTGGAQAGTIGEDIVGPREIEVPQEEFVEALGNIARIKLSEKVRSQALS